MKRKGKKSARILLAALCILSVLALTATAYVCLLAFSTRLDEQKLVDKENTVAILTDNGERMNKDAGYVSIEEIPKALQHAFVAVEDKRFYRHNGIDLTRIGGAAVANIRSRSFAQGASTISCQLIKNTHLNNEKTLKRKIQEAKLAMELEKKYDKDSILEMYLNVIYFGSGLYGVGNAAKGFFGKSVNDLTLAQCASIAATTVNPAKYSPRLNAQNNRVRRDMVLDLMVEQGYITEQECETAQAETVSTVQNIPNPYESYCINAIEEAERISGLSYAQLSQGYTVYTYCNGSDQQKCADTLSNGSDQMTLLATADGKICGYASNYSLRQSGIRRQPGSLIKPFVYACAIKEGIILPDSVLQDEETTFGDYKPQNYKQIYYGQLSARDALAKSSNVVACKVLHCAGLDNVYTFCIQCGLPLSPLDKHTALALGGLTYGVTADEIVTAYTVLADRGKRHNAAFVKAIEAPDGKIVYRFDSAGDRVLPEEDAYLVETMLQATVADGTAKQLGDLSGDVAAKTGTVAGKSENSDAWCVAYNSRYIALSWCGNLSMEKDKDVKTGGGGTPCLAVRHAMRGHDGYTFGIPNGVKYCAIDDYTLKEKGVLMQCSPNVPEQYRRRIPIKEKTALPVSTTFEMPLRADASIECDERIRVALQSDALYTYYVVVDMGDTERLIDEIEGDGKQERTYAYMPGNWRIYAVLHGKTDRIAPPYEQFIL